MDWSEAIQVAEAEQGYDDLKSKLPIPFILESYGIDVDYDDSGKGHSLCPFHADSNPSFDMWGENYERWGCYPCGLGGDVFDLIRRASGFTFPEALAEAQRLYAALQASDWKPHTGTKQFTLDLARVEQMVAGSAHDLSGLQRFLDARGAPFTAEQLHDSFVVGSIGQSIIIPYFTEDGRVATYKHRTLGTSPLAAPGSKFEGLLYGGWRDDPQKPVLLCEGESDTWAAAFYLSGSYSVLGLPTGAGTNPLPYLDRFRGRPVILAFDGDRAGRDGLRRWSGEIPGPVLAVPLPEGLDLWKLGDRLPEVISEARVVGRGPESALQPYGGSYYRPGKDTKTQVSNWTVSLARELTDEAGNLAYEGILSDGQEATITSADLSTAARTFSWSARHGKSWYGTDKDARTLLAQFQAEGALLEPASMSSVAGSVGSEFVYPAGHIGTTLRRYVPLGADPKLAERIWISPGSVSPAKAIEVLRALHRPEIIDPILAWLAAAPLRASLKQFPILSVTGASGTGKTTLIETVLSFFTGSLITTNLTGTTRYGIEALVSSTNAFPVWVDEYRPGIRAETELAFQQILRDAYTGQGSLRGGSHDNWQAVTATPVLAPIIVTGESAFEETSHTERMIDLKLPRDGRNPNALAAVQELQGSIGGAFAHTYLTWLNRNYDNLLWPLTPTEDRFPGLSARQIRNLSVLEWGWYLLDRFVQEAGHPGLPALAVDAVVSQSIVNATSNPILDALYTAMGDTQAIDFVFPIKDDVAVEVSHFFAYTRKLGLPLPGNRKAVESYILEQMDASVAMVKIGTLQKRVLLIPKSVLLPSTHEGDV